MQNNKNLIILFLTMIVVMLGFGMIIPILPFYIKSFGASGAALGALMSTYGVLQFVFAPIWGSYSDRLGRKPVLMIGVLGNTLAQLLFGLSTELWMLFAARALAGILSSATLPTAMAYVADTTVKDKRSGGMGFIGAAMGIGMVLGPGLGGLLAKNSLSLPFFLAAGLSLVALLLIFLVLPEPPHSEKPLQASTRKPQLAEMKQALLGPVGVLLLMAFLLSFALTNFEGIFGLYAADRYGFTPNRVGLTLTIIGLVSAVMQGAMTGPATRRFGEVIVIRAGMIGSAIGFVLMTQAANFPQVLTTACFFIFCNAMINPSVAALISKRAPGGQGTAMGLNNSFLSLGRIVGPLWAGLVYDLHMNLPYLSGAMVLLIGFVISLAALQPESSALITAEPPLDSNT